MLSQYDFLHVGVCAPESRPEVPMRSLTHHFCDNCPLQTLAESRLGLAILLHFCPRLCARLHQCRC